MPSPGIEEDHSTTSPRIASASTASTRACSTIHAPKSTSRDNTTRGKRREGARPWLIQPARYAAQASDAAPIATCPRGTDRIATCERSRTIYHTFGYVGATRFWQRWRVWGERQSTRNDPRTLASCSISRTASLRVLSILSVACLCEHVNPHRAMQDEMAARGEQALRAHNYCWYAQILTSLRAANCCMFKA